MTPRAGYGATARLRKPVGPTGSTALRSPALYARRCRRPTALRVRIPVRRRLDRSAAVDSGTCALSQTGQRRDSRSDRKAQQRSPRGHRHGGRHGRADGAAPRASARSPARSCGRRPPHRRTFLAGRSRPDGVLAFDHRTTFGGRPHQLCLDRRPPPRIAPPFSATDRCIGPPQPRSRVAGLGEGRSVLSWRPASSGVASRAIDAVNGPGSRRPGGCGTSNSGCPVPVRDEAVSLMARWEQANPRAMLSYA